MGRRVRGSFCCKQNGTERRDPAMRSLKNASTKLEHFGSTAGSKRTCYWSRVRLWMSKNVGFYSYWYVIPNSGNDTYSQTYLSYYTKIIVRSSILMKFDVIKFYTIFRDSRNWIQKNIMRREI